jgi:hypothetical protein
MSVIFRRTNILDPYSWTTGSGGTGNFSQNGNTGENERVVGTDPWGNSAIVWETRASGDGGADGGWNHSSFSVDNTKLYRMSVWVKRTSSTGGGTFYLGTNGGGQCVLRLDGGYGEECNPYWNCSGPGSLTQNQWYLFVGHVFPHTYPNSNQHADTGYWTTGGSKVGGINGCNVGNDMKFGPNTTSLNHRTYHYYCGDNTTRLQFFEPRVDLCDGSEPRITDLLNNTRNKLDSTSITTEGASFKNQKVIATGGVITEVGEWRIHRFNSSGTFTLSSLIGSSLPVEYLIVGGGGGGGTNMGGGGGGGGVLNGTTILTPTTYAITVGAGGAGAPSGTGGGHPTQSGTNGGNSSFNGLTSIGGGWGGVSYNTQGLGIHFGNSGGSGGGSAGYNNDGVAPATYGSGAGTSGQGFRGGYQGTSYYSGGGGGAIAAGTDGNNIANGGSGRLVSILGRPFYWGGGGGGAGYSTFGGAGGRGGGGAGAPNEFANNYGRGGRDSIEWGRDTLNGCTGCWTNLPGGDGGTNTGGGGGGGAHYNSNNKGGNGGSGIVIIRYKIK